MSDLLGQRRIPAEWTPEHRALADFMTGQGLDLADARPEWTETMVVVEDVDGTPTGVITSYSAVVTNCPPEDG